MGVQAVEGKSGSRHVERVRADQASFRAAACREGHSASCHRYETSVLLVVVVSSILDAMNESFAVESQVIIARVFLVVYTAEMAFRSWSFTTPAERRLGSLQRGNS